MESKINMLELKFVQIKPKLGAVPPLDPMLGFFIRNFMQIIFRDCMLKYILDLFNVRCVVLMYHNNRIKIQKVTTIKITRTGIKYTYSNGESYPY